MKKHSKIFKQFMLSYTYILTLPLCTCFLFFALNNYTLNMQTENRYKNEIEKAVAEVNSTFAYMNMCATQLSANNILNEYIDIIRSASRSTKSIQVINLLSNYMTTDSKISNIYIYTPQNDYLLTPAGGFEVSTAYDSIIRWDKLSYEELRDEILEKSNFVKLLNANNFLFLDTSDDYIACLHSLPMGNSDITGQLIIMSRKEDLQRIFSEYLDIPLNIKMYDKKGNILLQSQCISAEKQLTAYEFNHQLVDYEISVDTDSFSDGSAYLKQTLMLIMGLVLIISAVAAFLVAKKNISPIDRFLDHASKNSGDGYINFKSLEGLFDEISKRETAISNELAYNIDKTHSNIMNLLFKGEFGSNEELDRQMKLLNIDFKAGMYITMMAEIIFDEVVSYKELFAAKMLFNKTLSSHLRFLTMDFMENIEVFIFAFENGDSAECITYLEEVIMNAARLFKGRETIWFKLAVSRCYHSLIDAYGTFEETRSALNDGIQTFNENIIWCTLIEKVVRSSYYFPAKLKQNMRTAIKAGNTAAFDKSLDRLVYFNQKKGDLLKSEIEGIIYELKLIVQNSLDECGIDEEVKNKILGMLRKIRNDSLHSGVFKKFREISQMIAKSDLDKKQNRDKQLVNKMLDYIHANYQSSDFDRQSLADYCKLSPDYITKFFKASYGENFSEYLEKCRIEEACKLLQRNKNVEEIAHVVGYASDGSFRRAFKKVMGVTPGQYVNNYK